MSSDPYADLTNSLNAYCEALERALAPGWNEGSKAACVAADRSMSAEWGEYPGRDALLEMLLLSTSALDHLRALATLIVLPRAVYALSSVARGALEAVAHAHYLAELELDFGERVRRHMNRRLISLHESTRLSGSFDESPTDATSESKQAQADRIKKILTSADRYGFEIFSGDERRPPHIGNSHPSSLKLMEQVVAQATPALGAVYWRSLSAVAHSQGHGLHAYIEPVGFINDETRGDRLGAIRISAKELGLRHLGALLGTVSMASRVVALGGLDSSPLDGPTVRLLQVWGRIAEVPYPGPGHQ